MSRPLVLEITVDDKGNAVLKDMRGNVKALDKSTKGLGKTLTRVFASAVMLAALNKFRSSIAGANKEIMEFNKTFKQIEGITGTSGKALDSLKVKTLDVSNNTEHMTSAISKAVLSISKMGFTIEESLAVIPHVADLATASMVELDEAARVSVQTMKSFKLGAEDMEHIVNVIQGTVSKTAINFDEMSESLKFVAPISKAMNISLEETAAMIGKLGDVGIKGSLAGTTLKNMFLNIMKPSEDVAAILKDLNVEGKGFNEILKALSEANIPISSFLETFNKRAIAGSLALADMTDATDLLTEALTNDEIKVSDVADTIREAWIPQLQTLKNTFVNTFVAMGKILDDSDIGLSIEDISGKFIELQGWLEENPEALLKVAEAVAEFTEIVAHLGTDVYTFFIKNGKEVFSVMRGFLIWGTYGILIKTLTKKLALATLGMKNFKLATIGINPIVATAIASFEGLTYAVDKYIVKLDKLQKGTTDTTLEGIWNKIDALKELKKQMELGRKEIEIFPGKGPFKATTKLETEAEFIKRIVRDVSKSFSISEGFLEGSLDNIDSWIDGLIFKFAELSNIEDDRKAAQKAIEDALKKAAADEKAFRIQFAKDEKARAAEAATQKGIDDAFAYWDAALEVQKQFAGSFGLVPDAIRDKAFKPQFLELGIKSSLPSELPIPQLPVMGEQDFPLMFTQLISLNDERQRSIDLVEELTKKSSILVQTGKEEGVELSEFFKTLRDKDEEENKARQDNIVANIQGFMQASQIAIDTVQLLQDSKFQHLKSQHSEEMKMLDERAAREISNAEGNSFKQKIIAQKFAREKSKLAAKQAREEQAIKEKQKAWALIEVAINTAVGITQALRSAVFPANIAIAAAIGAMGAAQASIIASSDSFAGGGYTGGGSPTDVAGVVHRKEYVVDHASVDALGGPSGVKQMIDDRLEGATNSAPSVTVIVDTLIGTVEYERQLFVKLQKESQRWQQ